jgi:hypothetical protein
MIAIVRTPRAVIPVRLLKAQQSPPRAVVIEHPMIRLIKPQMTLTVAEEGSPNGVRNSCPLIP